MRILLFSAIILFASRLHAQEDYFYAENLVFDGKHTEADKVLTHLLESGAYNDRPSFFLMTLNLAGKTKCYLKDTLTGIKYFEDVMKCYDTLSNLNKTNNWNRREYYKSGYELARIHYHQKKLTEANKLLILIQCPGDYYSATGSDVLLAKDDYYELRARIFEHLNVADSAYYFLREIKERSSVPGILDIMFSVSANYLQHVKCVNYTGKDFRGNSTSDFLFFLAWTDSTNTQNTIWFIHPESGPMKIIGRSTYNSEDESNFPANCYTMSLSPDEKYLAVECYTEGSNHIDLFSFPEILSERRCILKQSILAYPSNVEIKGWENSLLLVESDADLTRHNKKNKFNFDVTPNPEVKHLFLFDPETGKFSKK